MTEPEENKERTAMEDNFADLRVSDISDDVGLSGLKVIVRRQDSSTAAVNLGMFENASNDIRHG